MTKLFCSSIPFEGLKEAISVKYLIDDDTKMYPTSQACLKLIHVPTVHSTEKKFFEIMNTALKVESKGFANP